MCVCVVYVYTKMPTKVSFGSEYFSPSLRVYSAAVEVCTRCAAAFTLRDVRIFRNCLRATSGKHASNTSSIVYIYIYIYIFLKHRRDNDGGEKHTTIEFYFPLRLWNFSNPLSNNIFDSFSLSLPPPLSLALSHHLSLPFFPEKC